MTEPTPSPKPGQFHATCKTGAWLPLHQLTEAERADLEAREADRTSTSPAKFYTSLVRYDAKLKCGVGLIPCALDTTDRAEFAAHMERAHGRNASTWSPSKGANADLVRKAQGTWRGPVAAKDNAPFKASTKAVAARMRTCPECGLIAEVSERAADVLWWHEHLERCVGTQTQVAS